MTDATSGMKGHGYYDAHSKFQAKVAESGADLIKHAAQAVQIPDDGKITIADYGCGEGRNSIATIKSVLEQLSDRQTGKPVVLHSDLPTNDWAGLARNLSGPESYLATYPDVRALFAPCGFFQRVTMPSSITIGTSGSAAHWLSGQPPGLDMPQSLYRSDAPPAERDKILKQAAKDWEAFLASRAEELQPGGILLVQMLGSDGAQAPVRVSAAGLLKLMNECALKLVHSGAIPKDAYASYCFPVVPRTVEEAVAPINGALSDRLELLHCGLTEVPSPYQSALEKTGDVEAFAKQYTAFTRAFSESSLRQGLFDHSKEDPDKVADKFYAMMESALVKTPEAYPFDDLTLAVLVQRRDKV